MGARMKYLGDRFLDRVSDGPPLGSISVKKSENAQGSSSNMASVKTPPARAHQSPSVMTQATPQSSRGTAIPSVPPVPKPPAP